MNKWLNIIQNRLFPASCILCNARGEAGRDICQECRAELEVLVHSCPICATPLEVALPVDTCCANCQSRPPHYQNSHATFHYRGRVRYMIRQFKFKRRIECGRVLAELMAEKLDQESRCPELLIPVPLHRNRYTQRGYNQAEIIATILARKMNCKIDLNVCQRIVHTTAQWNLTAPQRRKNVKNAFVLNKPIQANSVTIVDDVVTTGATVNELAKLLKSSGVTNIQVWSLARAAHKTPTTEKS